MTTTTELEPGTRVKIVSHHVDNVTPPEWIGLTGVVVQSPAPWSPMLAVRLDEDGSVVRIYPVETLTLD